MKEEILPGGAHIILTHEQADFDALGSLLGAYLLHDHALPLLPRRMNRNVKAFLSLYGADLPFIDPRDRYSSPVGHITLVDTQSMVSVKGMTEGTRVSVIDHHPKKENLPQNWSVITGEVGATTTLLVEELRELNGQLTPIQATLMLLGIYEDTGSLTYKRTSPRDLLAAAYLLEQGASLEIATSFLNHPLSLAQEELYRRLQMDAKHLHIHGYTIVIACGDAVEMGEELSSLAHKLRDYLDPDALFLLVTTRSGVQMIARSTTDNIDVAEVVVHFGGGGHERAAASLIRERAIEDVYSELIKILPEHVKPSITVAQIMSRGPQLLTPETTAEQAALRMSRFGHEGYPVVEQGKVVGLLTRRAVDRAIAHHLNTTASSLMEAGSYTVQPGDSIEYLQKLVAETGWGQVPVVSPKSGEIIGIVTRTDLLKTLTSQYGLPGKVNLAEKLEKAFSPERLLLIERAAQIAHERRDALYIVGGFVRDLILDQPSQDFDLVVEGDAIALAKMLARRFGGRVTSHARFGTAKWHLPVTDSDEAVGGENNDELLAIDLVSARTEFYTHPTALPTVERGSIKLDLHRRDFTMNTLAVRLDGRHYGDLHDYWGGLQDIQQGLVRVLHSLSFVDDPTRILRAVRFEQRFDFQIEERSLQLLREARSLIDRLSGDRIRHEINSIIADPAALKIFSRLNELGLLAAIHPELAWDDWLKERLKFLVTGEGLPNWTTFNEGAAERKTDLVYLLWLLRLPLNGTISVAIRLKLPVKLSEEIRHACLVWEKRDWLASARPSEIFGFLEDKPSVSIYANFLASESRAFTNLLLKYAQDWRQVAPAINGDELRRRGIPPGPIYRQLLSDIRSALLDGKISTAQDEEKLLQQLLIYYGNQAG